MQLIESFIRNPVKISVGVLLVALFGFVAAAMMPMQLTPEVQTPTITIETRWPGASPQEVEQEIVLEQEEQLKSVEGIVKMTSECSDSLGRITLEFLVGTNMEEALLKVNSRLQQVPEYPEDADEPVITTANSADQPIAWFILSARRPTPEEFDAFEAEHPELADALVDVRSAHNVGLSMLRLRNLAEENPTYAELLPPPDLEVPKLRRFAEDEIEARFERVPGVSQSNVLGGLEDELQVIVDPQRLAFRGLTIGDVREVLRGQNKDTSAGDFWEGKRRWVVRTIGQFKTVEQVENQLLTVRDGAPIYVRDVAEVRHGYKKPDGMVRRFGESSIAVNCLRESGANVLDVMSGLQEANAELNERVLNPAGLQLTQVYDETEYIYSAVGLVRENIFVGGALTMIVLMLFLHLGARTLVAIPLILGTALAAVYLSPLFFVITVALIIGAGFWFARGALVVGLAIPTSIIATFLVLGMLGRSLNVVSLAGLAFAVGMLVDNAVVVLENIYRRYRTGEAPFTAAARGAHEVSGAIVASTLTTVAVFLPVVFVQEEAGQLFRDIALAISAAIAISMLVSMTVISTASARLFGGDRAAEDKVSPAARPIHRAAGWFVDFVVSINARIQKSTMLRLAVVVLLVGGSLGTSYLLWPSIEYLPTGNRNLVFGILLPPPGYNLDELMVMGETVEAGMQPYWDVDPESPEAANLKYPVIDDFFFVARGRQVFLGIRAADPQRCAELIPLVQEVSAQLPGTFAVAKQSSLFEQGLTAGRTVDIEITGPELETMVGLGGQIIGQVGPTLRADDPRSIQARPIPSLDLSSPEIHIEPKLVQASEIGVSSSEIGYAANALIDGAYAGDYYMGGHKIDLTIVGITDYAGRTQDVEALPVATPLGRLVPLGALADVRIESGPEQINHRERVRAITIEVSPPPDMPLDEAMRVIDSEIVRPIQESGQLAGGYRITLAGTADKLTRVRETFVGKWTGFNAESIFSITTSQAFLVVVITYLLMAALFESWLYPLVIIFTVPLGAVGGLVGLKVLNLWMLQPLDVLTMLGFVILVGTVVNNPILIVHQSLNHMRHDGMRPESAILESVRTRIRPIFMTTITTVLGLLPLVLFPGAGSELYRGLGSVVLGGLLVSTVFTVVLVPTLFSLTMDAKTRLVELLRGVRGSQEPSRPARMPVSS